MKYRTIKTYGFDEGWSCTYRQPQATSHCRYIHGYAISVSLTFECEELDKCGWCYDFGGLKEVKAWLKDLFDHKTLVARDDPLRPTFESLALVGLIDMEIVPAVGCEKFAELVFQYVESFLATTPDRDRVRLVSAMVSEHAGNSAVCIG